MSVRKRWIYRDAIVSYVAESYAGTEPAGAGGVGSRRRLFIWEEGGDLVEGNAEAFTLHVGRRFELPLEASDAADLHHLMRLLGERVLPPRADKRRGPPRGDYRQPEPQQRVIGPAPTEEPDTDDAA